MPNHSTCTLIGLSLLCLFASGCGGGSVQLVPVTGTVTLDGQPLADARVIFHPEEGGRPSNGITDDDGNFELVYIEEQRGALVGKHKVSVSTFIEADPDSSDSLIRNGQKETVPAKYNAQTTLEAELESGNQEPLTFELKST